MHDVWLDNGEADRKSYDCMILFSEWHVLKKKIFPFSRGNIRKNASSQS